MSLLAEKVFKEAQAAMGYGHSPVVQKYAKKDDAPPPPFPPTLLQIIDELCKEDSIRMMIYATLHERPALEPVIYKVEALCRYQTDFDVFNDKQARQAIGVIVKIIMGHYGFIPSENSSPIKKSDYLSSNFKTAHVYKSKTM